MHSGRTHVHSSLIRPKCFFAALMLICKSHNDGIDAQIKGCPDHHQWLGIGSIGTLGFVYILLGRHPEQPGVMP